MGSSSRKVLQSRRLVSQIARRQQGQAVAVPAGGKIPVDVLAVLVGKVLEHPQHGVAPQAAEGAHPHRDAAVGQALGQDGPLRRDALLTVRAAYATGRGKITLRGRATIEETKNGRTQIIITEIPYMVNKARLIENMADLVKDKRIEGITGLNDETNRKGMRIVVDVRKDANAQVILNQLYQYTQLQDTVGVIMLAIAHKVPKVDHSTIK